MAHPKWLGSSANPDKISRTLKSAVPLIVLILATFNLDVAEGEVDTILMAIISVLNGCLTLFYAVKRIINWWKNR